jgi:hypothetical protein
MKAVIITFRVHAVCTKGWKRNDPYLVQAFLKKWWVESDFKVPNLPLSLRLKVSGCHYNSIYNNTWKKPGKTIVKAAYTWEIRCSEGVGSSYFIYYTRRVTDKRHAHHLTWQSCCTVVYPFWAPDFPWFSFLCNI